ncbi:MAG TPA: ASCH domain-containing protein [Pyrinomonadaceae bacterium]|nr:ASCH domain-containing protein [Pyrinomonadaceae bacterium]
MKVSPQVAEFWKEFCAANPQINPGTPFQVWYFGNSSEMATELCNLVLEGKKTATASLPWEYEEKPEDAPVLGGYSVVTDFAGNPKCVVRTTEIRVLPFNEVDAEFAFDEGEGDQSLDYWREVHWDYFSRSCADSGKEPDTEMPVNCERFELLYF